MNLTFGHELVLYALIFGSAFMGFQVLAGVGRQAHKKVRNVNMRLKKMESQNDPVELLLKMRRERGMGDDGHLKALNRKLGLLVLHSGLPLGSLNIYAILCASALTGGLIGFLFGGGILPMIAGFAAGAALPVLVLMFFVKRRKAKAVAQLPEALEVVIRSLKAGHPVPVAIGMVGRELPDPLGSEFGTVSDELSYGADMSTAVQRLADRVGQEDFDLTAAMIRLQERTGGNLAELLESNADTIRQRQRMRLKIKAASAEGRASALILNAAPIGLYLIVRVAAPDFYGSVEGSKLVEYGLWGVVIWMVIGNLVMRKMINFKV